LTIKFQNIEQQMESHYNERLELTKALC